MAPDETDATDARIVAALQQDGRADLLDIAERTGVPGTTVRDRLRALESEGVVEGIAPRIDYEAAGYPLTVIFRMAVPDDRLGDVTERLGAEPRLVTVYEVTGRWDVFAIGKFAAHAELDTFSRELLTNVDVRALDASVAVDTLVENAPVDPTDA